MCIRDILRSKVDTALDTNTPYDHIIKIANAYGIKLSKATLSRYSSARKEAAKSGTDLREVLDGGKKKLLDQVKSKEVEKSVSVPKSETISDIDTVTDTEPTGVVTKRVTDLQVLDLMISKGFDAMINLDVPPSYKDLQGAIKLKAQMTNNANAGLTAEGLRTLRLELVNYKQAMLKTLFKYVPEDKQNEAAKAIDDSQKEWETNMETSPQGAAILDALRETGISL